MTQTIETLVQVTLPSGEILDFTFRPTSSPAAFTFLDEHTDALTTVRIDSSLGRDAVVEQARKLHQIFFPTPTATNENMQMVLAGPHQRIDWHRDVSWVRQAAILTDWLTRLRTEVDQAIAAEQDRLSNLKEDAQES